MTDYSKDKKEQVSKEKEDFFNEKKVYFHSEEGKILSNKLESDKELQAYSKFIKSFKPDVKAKHPATFTFYASAKKSYVDAFYNIINYYPFDGTKEEILNWHLDSFVLDSALLRQFWPGSVGHVELSNHEYINFYAGPQSIPESEFTGKFIQGESALKLNFQKGCTVEFWLKKESFPDPAALETVVNIGTFPGKVPANLETNLKISLSSSGGMPFHVTLNSGAIGITDHQLVTDSMSAASVADNKWHHYSFQMVQEETVLKIKLYVDGSFHSITTSDLGAIIPEIDSFMAGSIGCNLSDTTGNLTASIDEFRFWKGKRTAEQISKFFDKKVYASDFSIEDYSSRLGIKFSFNKENVDITQKDSLVIDFSGHDVTARIKNYNASCRKQTSAIDQSENSVNVEPKDPILQEENDKLISLYQELISIGQSFDKNNNNTLKKYLPEWTREKNNNLSDSVEFDNLMQILSIEFDTIKMSVDSIRKLSTPEYSEAFHLSSPESKEDPVITVYDECGTESFYFSCADSGIDYEVITGNEIDFSQKSFDDLGLNRTKFPLLFLATPEEEVESIVSNIALEKSIYETRNLIYKCLFNTYAFVANRKGTENSYKSILNTISAGGDVISTNIYGTDAELFISNTKLNNEIKELRSISFAENKENCLFLRSENTIERSYVQSDQEENEFTFEGSFSFPDRKDLTHEITDSSIFGIHEVEAVNNNLNFSSPDRASIQVSVIKEDEIGKNAKFVLSSDSGIFETIETDIIKDIYDNSIWNISVRVFKESGNRFLPNSSQTKFKIKLSGRNFVTTNLASSFDIETEILESDFINFHQSNKTFFLGAHRQNITGSLIKKSDVKVFNFSAWKEMLSDEEINLKSTNLEIDGIYNFIKSRNINNNNKNLVNLIFRMSPVANDSLELDNTIKVTDSSINGQKIIDSFGPTIGSRYNFTSLPFTSALENVIQAEFVSVSSNIPIANLHGQDGVQIKNNDANKFDIDSRPNLKVLSFEKSMYRAISNEMIKFLGGVSFYNNAIGEPVNKYRKSYKTLDYLRAIFYEGVDNSNQFERYVRYYRWIDKSIGQFLKQLVPASLLSNTGIENVVESHALERNKYDHKLIRINNKDLDLATNLLAINELLYDWEHGHFSPDEDEHCLWQKDRKRKSLIREPLRKVLTTVVTGSNQEEYFNDYVLRNLIRPYKFSGQNVMELNIGHNRNANKIRDLYEIVNSGKEITVEKEDFYEFKKCDDVLDPQKEKIYFAKTNTTDTDGYLDADADLILPFTFYSSSVGTDFAVFKDNLKITNNHDRLESITSINPFTDLGMPHRNVKIGTPSEDRPEAYNLDANSQRFTLSSANGPRSLFHRNLQGSYFYNISNIKTQLNPFKLGNYSKDYEIVMTNGRRINNTYLVETEGSFITGNPVVPNLALPGITDFEVPTRTRREHVIVNKFSAPGSAASSAPFSQDRESEELTVYNTVNYRNSVVRNVYNQLSREFSEKFGFRSGSATQASIHKTNRNYRFFKDELGLQKQADNFYVTHQIPQNDFGYSWITASATDTIYEFLEKNNNHAHQHNFNVSGSLNSNETLSFLKQGEHFVTSGKTSDEIEFFGPPPEYARYDYPSAHVGDVISFNNLNLYIVDPINLETNIMGDEIPIIQSVEDGMSIDQIRTRAPSLNPYTVKNISMFNSQHVMPLAGLAAPIVFHSIILNRQGPYGWPSWKQIRGRQHPIVKGHVKNNSMSIVFRGNDPHVQHLHENSPGAQNEENEILPRVTRNYKEIRVTNKFRPTVFSIHLTNRDDFNLIDGLNELHLLDNKDSQKRSLKAWQYDNFFESFGIEPDGSFIRLEDRPTFSQRFTINNDLSMFANRRFQAQGGYNEESYFDSSALAKLDLMIQESQEQLDFISALKELNYVEKVYPREINTFTKDIRTREKFIFFGWNSDRDSRQLTMGGTLDYDFDMTPAPPADFRIFPKILKANETEQEKSFVTKFYDTIDTIDLNHTESNQVSDSSLSKIQSSNWVLDARRDYTAKPVEISNSFFTNGIPFLASRDQGTRGEGILQNDYSIFGLGINFLHGAPPWAPVYNRRIPQTTSTVTVSNDPGTLQRYDLSMANDVVQNKIFAYNPVGSYTPHMKFNDGTISGVGETVDLNAMIDSAGGNGNGAAVYKKLSSQDLQQLSPSAFPTTGSTNPLAHGPSIPIPVQILEAATGGDISPLTALYPDLEDSELIFLSFTGLSLNINDPNDWNVTGGPNDTFTNPGWLTLSSGRLETRIYRNGQAWVYKVNPGDSSSYRLLAEFDIPELTLLVDWDSLISHGANSTGHIIASAKLTLREDYTVNSSLRPDPNGDTIHLTSSTQLIVSAAGQAPPTAVYATDGDFDNYIKLLDPLEITVAQNKALLAGEARWDAAINHKLGPFYNSYEQYAEEARLVGQQYSVIPEFTISSFSEDVINKMVTSGMRPNEIYSDIQDFLHLTGAIYHESSEEFEIGSKFYKTYATGDFLKYYSEFNDNIEDSEFDLKPFRLTLRCKAVKRFLPYRGFYPAERSVQLTEIFNRCYNNEDSYVKDFSMLEGDRSQARVESIDEKIKKKLRNSHAQSAKLFFAPGVLYNSIKSGLAVDYPVFQSSDGNFDSDILRWSMEEAQEDRYGAITDFDNISNDVGSALIGTEINDSIDSGIPRIKGNVDYRVSFEDMLEPSRLFSRTVHDNEPHPSASLYYGSRDHFEIMDRPTLFGTLNPDNVRTFNGIEFERSHLAFRYAMAPYSVAMENFAVNTVDFFLKDQKLQTIMSSPIEPRFEQGRTYKMKVILSNNNIKVYDRHSAFGPPVDDGDPIFRSYAEEEQTLTGLPAMAEIHFSAIDDYRHLDQNTITLEDASGTSKTYIFVSDGTTLATRATAQIDYTGKTSSNLSGETITLTDALDVSQTFRFVENLPAQASQGAIDLSSFASDTDSLDGETFTLTDNNGTSPLTATYRFIKDTPSTSGVASQGQIAANVTNLDGETFTLTDNESSSTTKTYRFIEDETSSASSGQKSTAFVEFEDASDIDQSLKSFNDDVILAAIRLKTTQGKEFNFLFTDNDEDKQAEVELFFPQYNANENQMTAPHPNLEFGGGNTNAPIDNQVLEFTFIDDENGASGSTTTMEMIFVREDTPTGSQLLTINTTEGLWPKDSSGRYKIFLKANGDRRSSGQIMLQMKALLVSQNFIPNGSHVTVDGQDRIRIKQSHNGHLGNTQVKLKSISSSSKWFQTGNKNETTTINALSAGFNESINGRWSDFHHGANSLQNGDLIDGSHPLAEASGPDGDVFVFISGQEQSNVSTLGESMATKFAAAVNNLSSHVGQGFGITAQVNFGRGNKQTRVDLQQDQVGTAGDTSITFNTKMTDALTGHINDGTPDKADFSGGQDQSSGTPTIYTSGQVLTAHSNQIAVALGDGTKSVNDIAEEMATAIKSSSGHNNTISATASGNGKVDLTQATVGASGDKVITISDATKLSKSNFANGADATAGTQFTVGQRLTQHSNQIAIPITGLTLDAIGLDAMDAVSAFRGHSFNHYGVDRIEASWDGTTSILSLTQRRAGSGGDTVIGHSTGLASHITDFAGGSDGVNYTTGDAIPQFFNQIAVNVTGLTSSSDFADQLTSAIFASSVEITGDRSTTNDIQILTQDTVGSSGNKDTASSISSFITDFGSGEDETTLSNGDLDASGRVVVLIGLEPDGTSVLILLQKAIESSNGHDGEILVSIVEEEVRVHEYGKQGQKTRRFEERIPGGLILQQAKPGTSGNNLMTGTGKFFGPNSFYETQTPGGILRGFKGGKDELTDTPRFELKEKYSIVHDSHGFLPYVPPYLDANTQPYAEISFKAPRTGIHSIPEIIAGSVVTYENGIDTFGNSSSTNTKNAMDLSATLNLLGHVTLLEDNVRFERTSDTDELGSNIKETRNPADDRPRWVIQTKWETPVLDFKNQAAAALNLENNKIEYVKDSPWQTRYQTNYYQLREPSEFNYLTSSTGIWHQKGEIPSNLNGYTLSVEGPDQVTSEVGNLATALGFMNVRLENPGTVNMTKVPVPVVKKLGEIADEKEICEAVVVIPFYQIKEGEGAELQFIPVNRRPQDGEPSELELAKKINSSMKRKFLMRLSTIRDEDARREIRKKYENWYDNPSSPDGKFNLAYQLRMMDKFILPPHFDFTRNEDILPHLQYIFQFKATIKKDELSQLWQNLYPDSESGIFRAQHSNIYPTDEQKDREAITIDNEFISSYLDVSPILDAASKIESPMQNPYEFVRNKIRWLVFKAKFRSNVDYESLQQRSIAPQDNIIQMNSSPIRGKQPKLSSKKGGNSGKNRRKYGKSLESIQFNWPYDFFSIVEMAEVFAKVDHYSDIEALPRGVGNPETVFEVPAGSADIVSRAQEVLNKNFTAIDFIPDSVARLGDVDFSTTNLSSTLSVESASSSDIQISSDGSEVTNQLLKDEDDAIPSPANRLNVQVPGGLTIKPGSETVKINGVVQSPSGSSPDYTIQNNPGKSVVELVKDIEKNDVVTISYIMT